MEYKVKSGDTLTKIAKAHNLSLDALLAMNNMTREQANKIQVGQSIKINSEPIPKNVIWNVPTNFGDKSPFNKPQLKSRTISSPYKEDYSEQDYIRDNAKSIQQQLIAEKYNVGQWGADGKWGKSSQAALDKAKQDGYELQGTKLVKKPDAKSKLVSNSTSTVAGTYIPWTPSLKSGEQCGVDGCAQYANDALKKHVDSKQRKLYSNKNIGGHAWTRLTAGKQHKMIYSGYDSEDYDRNNFSNAVSDARNFKAADKLLKEFKSSTLDPNKIYMVNMFYKGSPSRRQAWEEAQGGTTGTHTGNLYFNKDTNRWHVSHNIHGTIYDDDFIKIQGSKGRYGVTAIAEAIANDYTEDDRRDTYRQANPIKGWIKDTLNMWKKGGTLIPRAQKGLSVTYNVPKKFNGDWDYNTATPEGYDLSHIGIHRTYEGQKTYGNSDSLPIAHSLEYINNRLPELANRYNLTIDEARTLLGDSQAVMWNESGGASSKKVNPRTQEVVDSTAYNSKDNNPLYMLGVRTVNSILGRGTSEGYGRVKVQDLKDLPYYSQDTEQELNQYSKRTPHFSGLSTFASMAQRYHKLKDIFKNDSALIYGEDGSLNELGHALLLTSHNQGFNNIQKNYDKYKQSGDINELEQYKTFRYPKLSLQLIKGHEIDGSIPEQLPELIVTASRK